MAAKRRPTTWAEIEALPPAAQEAFRKAFVGWVETRFAVDLAHYWPSKHRRLRGVRSPHGFALRQASGWPECWFQHGWVRDCLVTLYVWDQDIGTGKPSTAAADRARYHDHVRDVVVPEVQQIAHLCELRHVDPGAPPPSPEPWEPSPPPLPGEARRRPPVGVPISAWQKPVTRGDRGRDLGS